MKRIFSFLLVLAMLAGIVVLPVAAKSRIEVIEEIKRDPVIFNGLCRLCGAIESAESSGEPGKIFACVLEIYPDWIAAIKKHSEGNSTTGDAAEDPEQSKRYREAVKSLLSNQIFTDDFVKLAEAVEGNDAGKIFSAVLEIFPDFIEGLKKGMNKYDAEHGGLAGSMSEPRGSDLTLLWVLCAGVGGMLIGGAAVYLLMKKKRDSEKQES